MIQLMKRKAYESPTTKVVMLKQRARLLAGSVESMRKDYGDAIGDEWE